MSNFTFERLDQHFFSIPLVRFKVLGSCWKDAPAFVVREGFVKNYEKVRDLEIFSDDVWMLCYPKTGSTWAEEMIWLLNNNLDFETANTVVQTKRFPFFDSTYVMDYNDKTKIKFEFDEETLQRPRHIKSHFGLPLLPKKIWAVKPKIVHISRNPKDVALSRYHFDMSFYKMDDPIEKFLDDFMDDKLEFHPFIEHHLMCWNLEKEGYPNILYLTYEEMINNIDATIMKTQKFLGKFYSPQKIEQLKEHLKFDNMKSEIYLELLKFIIQWNLFLENMAVNHSHQLLDPTQDKTLFMRKGKSGSYKKDMPAEYIEKFDKWLKKSLENKEHRFNLT